MYKYLNAEIGSQAAVVNTLLINESIQYFVCKKICIVEHIALVIYLDIAVKVFL